MNDPNFYPNLNEENTQENLNEVYNDDIEFLSMDEACPNSLKKQFKMYAHMIHIALAEENFSDYQVEDYLKKLVDDAV